MTESSAAAEVERFKIGQQVTTGEIKEIVAPRNNPDFVENTRLRFIGDHVNRITSGDLLPHEIGTEQDYLRHLGAEAILEYLPTT